MEPDTPWLTRQQAAEYLGVSVVTLNRYAWTGGGPHFHKPSHKVVRYHRDDLDKWMMAARK